MWIDLFRWFDISSDGGLYFHCAGFLFLIGHCSEYPFGWFAHLSFVADVGINVYTCKRKSYFMAYFAMVEAGTSLFAPLYLAFVYYNILDRPGVVLFVASEGGLLFPNMAFSLASFITFLFRNAGYFASSSGE